MKLSLAPALVGLLVAGSLVVALPAAAHGDHHRAGRGEMQGFPDMQGGRLFRGLDLTQEQRDQAFRIFHALTPEIRSRMQAAQQARQELRQMALAPNFDAGRARELADQHAKALSEAALMRAQSMSQVVSLLTPEQRAKLEEMRKGREQRRR